MKTLIARLAIILICILAISLIGYLIEIVKAEIIHAYVQQQTQADNPPPGRQSALIGPDSGGGLLLLSQVARGGTHEFCT